MEGYEIDRACWAQINGDRQNIRLLGRKAGSPVLLFLHGGPGVCDRHLVLRDQRPLANRFTLALWDQRGAGKSFSRETLTRPIHLEDCLADGEEVIRWLCRELGCSQVVLVCHSWGTVLGVPLAQRHPELVRAYVGQGQFVNGEANERLSYQFCLDEARRRGDRKAERRLLVEAQSDSLLTLGQMEAIRRGLEDAMGCPVQAAFFFCGPAALQLEEQGAALGKVLEQSLRELCPTIRPALQGACFTLEAGKALRLRLAPGCLEMLGDGSALRRAEAAFSQAYGLKVQVLAETDEGLEPLKLPEKPDFSPKM